MPPNIGLTLIVAATPEMGIGFKGSLPWPTLKSEMAYFSRVTRRAPPSHTNAVIMGRRTWESIPPKSRPLKDRVNVVMSRRPESLNLESGEGGPTREGVAFAASGIHDALAMLQAKYGKGNEGQGLTLSRVFVIGGAEIYSAVLEMENTKRILLTKVRNHLECDTFFPLGLESTVEGSDSINGGIQNGKSWVKRSKVDLDAWAGEDVPAGIQHEGDIQWEFEMWEADMTKP